ncbi:sensor domain-containing protein [Streptomyces spiramyceticus]|uniref:sensor domain-containing protein n=1 Tax=Streptomyces spiramyceticus TaxID=299717 RepID=UPI00237AF01E|nr:sensor domain-containing protein [Streptomyces spiramyceticus]
MASKASKTVWAALRRPTFLLTSWPWRAVAYLLSSTPVGVLGLIAVVTAVAVGGALAIVVVGVPLLMAAFLSGVPMGAIERRRLCLLDRRAARTPHGEPDRPGLREWCWTRFREPASWRELAYTLLFVTVLWPLDLLAVVFAFTVPVGLMATPYMLAAYGHGESVMALKQWLVTSYPEAWAMAALGLVLLPAAAYALTVVAGFRAYWARTFLT